MNKLEMAIEGVFLTDPTGVLFKLILLCKNGRGD
jgi:hypothetical protein